MHTIVAIKNSKIDCKIVQSHDCNNEKDCINLLAFWLLVNQNNLKYLQLRLFNKLYIGVNKKNSKA